MCAQPRSIPRQPKSYSSRAKKLQAWILSSTDGRNSYSYLENQLAILRSDPLLRRVAIKELAPAQTKDSQVAAENDQSDPASAEKAIVAGINRLRGALAVSRSGQAQVLNIAITWDDPERAAQLANAVADAYVIDQLDARLELAKRASGWLSDRLIELRRQLRDSEDAVAKFRQEHGLTRSGPTVALNDQQLADLNSKLIAARTDVAEKKARVNFLADLAAGKKTLDPCRTRCRLSSKLIGALRGKLADVSQREADLLARYNSRHPAVVNVEAEKRDIERSIAAETQRMAETVKSDYALAQARLDAMEQSMRQATGQGELDNDDAVKLRELERTAAVNKTLFEEFLQKAKITDEQATFRARDVRVIMPAQAGGQTFPDARRTLIDGADCRARARRRRRIRNGNVKGRLHNPARSRGGAGNSRAGLCASPEQEPTRQRRKDASQCHSTKCIFRSRLSAKPCAPCAVASICRTSTSRLK